MKSLALVIAVSLASAPLRIAFGQDVCSAVLNARAFDVMDSQTNVDYKKSTLDQLCKTRWSNRSDFENRARNLNIGGSYLDIFSVSMGGSTNDTTESMAQDYHNLCELHDSRLSSSFFNSVHVQSTSQAVAAWRDCVISKEGLWSALQLTPDSTKFTIHVHFKAPPSMVDTPQGKLMLTGYPHDGGFKCSVNDLDAANLRLADHLISDNFIMSCELTTDNSAQAFINTNYQGGESIGPFLVASRSYNELTQKIEDLNNKMNHIDIVTTEVAATQKTAGVVTCDPGLQNSRLPIHTCPCRNLFVCREGSIAQHVQRRRM